jgi:uncharacterized protein YndB with AHSA1/START domain
MTEHTVKHATFSLQRTYRVTPDRVFAAWSDPKAKARWFAASNEHQLDFRIGGKETIRSTVNGNTAVAVESAYHDIVPGKRIVYATTLSADGRLATLSLTTVEFTADGDGTKLTLIEQGTFLDGQEEPAWREQGTGDWLDALGAELDETADGQS